MTTKQQGFTLVELVERDRDSWHPRRDRDPEICKLHLREARIASVNGS